MELRLPFLSFSTFVLVLPSIPWTLDIGPFLLLFYLSLLSSPTWIEREPAAGASAAAARIVLQSDILCACALLLIVLFVFLISFGVVCVLYRVVLLAPVDCVWPIFSSFLLMHA